MQIEYVRPKWREIVYNRTKQFDYSTVTDEQLTEWQTEQKEVDVKNKEIVFTKRQWIKEFLSVAAEVFRKDSRQYRYIEKEIPYCTVPNYDLEGVIQRVKEAREKKRKDVQLTELQKKIKELENRAVQYLLQRGKIYGTDFTAAIALTVANDIVYEETVVAKQKELTESNGFVNFDGDDYCENYNGWDGNSSRCDCGNRRVYWSQLYGSTFENMQIYGEAN